MNKFKRFLATKKTQQGFSLLEVMIALIVSNVALLGLVAGELKSLQYANNSYQYTVSLVQANNVVERVLNDVCNLTGKTFTTNYVEQDLALVDGYTLDFSGITPGGIFVEEFTVKVAWVDSRMADQSTNQVAVTASFPVVPEGCDVNGSS